MSPQELLSYYRRQRAEYTATCDQLQETIAKLQNELKECERHGEIPSQALIEELQKAQDEYDWCAHQSYELRLAIADLSGQDE